MAYTTIDDPTIYFNTKLYTGTGSSHAVSGIGFQPDWVWIKCRDDSHNHQVFDSVRGVHNRMRTDTNGAETSSSESLKSFDSDGFTLGTQANVNASASGDNSFVAWNWKAGGTASSNGDGSITSSVSANTTSGFSIVSYTGTGSNATVGHGLGAVPSMIITKARTPSGRSWGVYHASLGNTKNLYLDGTDAVSTGGTFWNSTTPTSSVFSVGTAGDSNGSTYTLIAYCFAEKKGYSKFGSYTGNGNADGTFLYTGFKPAFFICKRYNDAGYDWLMYDNKRQVSFNVVDDFLKPNLSDAETTGNANQSLDFLSNGVKHRGNGASSNGSGATYIYMAFAENPFVTSTGIPTTAR